MSPLNLTKLRILLLDCGDLLSELEPYLLDRVDTDDDDSPNGPMRWHRDITGDQPGGSLQQRINAAVRSLDLHTGAELQAEYDAALRREAVDDDRRDRLLREAGDAGFSIE